MRKNRILAYVHAYVGHGRDAGAETTLHDLLKGLVAAGWEANVVLSRALDKPFIQPYWAEDVFVRMEENTDTLLEAAEYADVLITHLDCSERVTYVGQRADKPVVHLVHNTMWQTSGYLALGPDLIVYNTDWVKAFHEGNSSPVASIPHLREVGADTSMRVDFVAIPERTPTKIPGVVVHPAIDPNRYVATDGDHDHITYINFFANKGPEVFWELAVRMPHVKFLGVLGGYGDQEIPDEIPPNVELVDNTPDMQSVYSRTRAIIMPSKYESFGRVAVEAAASGIPTIFAQTPGLMEALQPQPGPKSGLMLDEIDSGDISCWMNAVDAVLSGNYYPSYSAKAKQLSLHWEKTRPYEMRNFVETLEKFVPGR